MQPDFEPILERQIHHLINGAEGIWHMGQRDINWIRISKAAKDKGFKIRHLGEILHAKFLNDYPAIVDKVQVTLFTDAEGRREAHARSRATSYRARNLRMESMTDESVDTFYSCLLCQSFAPNHVCVITPERLGLCGAYNWLDGKAAYEIDPTGPNQPLVKGECIDPVRGQWQNINDYVYANSKQTHRALQRLLAAGRPDDQLRLLRGHRRPAAGVQRGDDREPRVPGRNAGGHEVLHAGRTLPAAASRCRASSASARPTSPAGSSSRPKAGTGASSGCRKS